MRGVWVCVLLNIFTGNFNYSKYIQTLGADCTQENMHSSQCLLQIISTINSI